MTVTGWLRQDSEAGDEATEPSDGTVRALSADTVAESSAHPLLGGWVQAREESPDPATPLVGPEPPELDSGPHFFYAMQWFFFALLALAGYLYFGWDEAHPGPRTTRSRRDSREDPSPVVGRPAP